jgi:hypothetical protein
MDPSDAGGTAHQHPIGQAKSAIATALPSHNIQRQDLSKRTSGETVHDETPPVERHTKKKTTKRKRNSGGTVPTGEASLSSASVGSMVGTATNEKKKEKHKSKKRKHSETCPEGPHAAADHGLDLASIIKVPATAVDPPVSEGYPEQSGNDSIPQFNSNDDILRAFQVLDFSRLAGVLRNLEIPSAGVDLPADDNPFATFIDPDGLGDDQIATVDTEHPVATTGVRASTSSDPSRISGGVVGTPSAAKKLPKSKPKTNSNLPAIGPSIANPVHTEMLATKWLSSSKLKELVASEGTSHLLGCTKNFTQPLRSQGWFIRRGNSHL